MPFLFFYYLLLYGAETAQIVCFYCYIVFVSPCVTACPGRMNRDLAQKAMQPQINATKTQLDISIYIARSGIRVDEETHQLYINAGDVEWKEKVQSALEKSRPSALLFCKRLQNIMKSIEFIHWTI